MAGEPQQETNTVTSARMRAFTQAFNLLGSRFYNYFLQRVGNQATAEDLNLAFWQSVYRTFPEEKFEEYGLLYRKARQVYLNHLEYAGVRAFLEYTDTPPDTAQIPSRPMPSTEAEENSLKEWLWEQVPDLKLSAVDQEIVWMKAHRGHTFQELADMFKLPESTVQDRYKNAVALMTKAYRREDL